MFPLKFWGVRQFLLAWISSDYLESLLLPLVRGENESKQSDEIQAKFLCALSIFGISKIPTQCLKEALVT